MTHPVRAWRVAVILALAPIWLVGILDRGLWTPDEPREADISWSMSQQTDHTLPHLAGKPFLEKPPLSYWLSATAISVLGDTAAAARAPNILYAVITALAVGSTAYLMAGSSAAFLCVLLTGSLLIAFRVTVWLAPDASLLAGCSLALYGAYAGYISTPGRRKLLGYTLMHLGAAMGFMAKSAPGWIVPALALGALIVWERRWTELRRPELYAGLILQVLIIGPWIVAVARSPIGHEALLTFFWHNLVGRFTRVAGPAALDYTTGHANWVGKYLVELPVYLLPWTLLALAALWRAWTATRTAGLTRTAWRFSVAASLPWLVILSAAATARDVYAAPAMPGFGLLIALWAVDRGDVRFTSRLDELALSGTRAVIALVTVVFAAFLLLLAAAASGNPDSSPGPALFVAAAVVIALIAIIALWLGGKAQRRHDIDATLRCSFAAYAGVLCVACIAAFPAIDDWQDLPALAAEVQRETIGTPLALLDPDETTLAILDDRVLIPVTLLSSHDGDVEEVVSGWFRQHGRRAHILVLLPGHAEGPVSRLLSRLRPVNPPGDGVAGSLAADHAAVIVRRLSLPQGRRYALLGPP